MSVQVQTEAGPKYKKYGIPPDFGNIHPTQIPICICCNLGSVNILILKIYSRVPLGIPANFGNIHLTHPMHIPNPSHSPCDGEVGQFPPRDAGQ